MNATVLPMDLNSEANIPIHIVVNQKSRHGLATLHLIEIVEL